MKTINTKQVLFAVLVAISFTSCAPKITEKVVNKEVPESFGEQQDTNSSSKIVWKDFYSDSYLSALIDTALKNNQELNIFMQEMSIAKNEVGAKKGEYLPSVGVGVDADMDKSGEYTRNGAIEANHEVKKGTPFPNPYTELNVGLFASWEIDVWKKLRNAKNAALNRYLASIEGKNLMETNLVAEIANAYYELLALDKELAIVNQNIAIQQNAYEIVKLQKESAQLTELAVRRFEAQLQGTKSLRYKIKQEIVETENQINYLVGRFPQTLERNTSDFDDLNIMDVNAGIPSQLLQNRPDIRQAELEIVAARLDLKSARANFYPSLRIKAGLGLNSFGLSTLVNAPAAVAYNLGGELLAPLVNRKAIKSVYFNASNRQVQTVYEYEKTVLKAHIEVLNLISKMDNLNKTYELIDQQVQSLTTAVEISNDLFKSARADYLEILLNQRDALESKFKLVETKKEQLHATVDIYRALGGGWSNN